MSPEHPITAALAEAVRADRAVLSDASRLSAALTVRPEVSPSRVTLLASAVTSGAASQLAATESRDSMLEARLAQQLVLERMLSDSDARWAVETWAEALHAPPAAAARPAATVAPTPPPAPPAPAMTTLPPEVESPVLPEMTPSAPSAPAPAPSSEPAAALEPAPSRKRSRSASGATPPLPPPPPPPAGRPVTRWSASESSSSVPPEEGTSTTAVTKAGKLIRLIVIGAFLLTFVPNLLTAIFNNGGDSSGDGEISSSDYSDSEYSDDAALYAAENIFDSAEEADPQEVVRGMASLLSTATINRVSLATHNDEGADFSWLKITTTDAYGKSAFGYSVVAPNDGGTWFEVVTAWVDSKGQRNLSGQWIDDAGESTP